jgi:predicted nucleic acid-binding protein
MASQQTVYIDTHVFAYVLLRDPQYKGMLADKATRFFNDIQSGKYLGIISTFTETEYRSVVKKVISSLRQSKKKQQWTILHNSHKD